MAFKTLAQYNDERNRVFFKLDNDGDNADVVFLYRNLNDVMLADAHYIKSSEYSGYVHCCGKDCPACAKGIRIQSKIFVPVLVLRRNDEALDTPELKYFDRTTYFKDQLMTDVFNKSANPTDCIFRITRHGVARDTDTKYEIVVKYLNTLGNGTGLSHYDAILKQCGVTMPEDYERVIKEFSVEQLSKMLTPAGAANDTSNLSEYPVTPRVAVPSAPSQPIDSVLPPVTTVIDAPIARDTAPAETLISDTTVDTTEELDDEDVHF